MLNNKYVVKAFWFLIIIIPFLIGFKQYPLFILGTDLSYLPGDYGDARFINYVLEHGYQYIIGNRDSFYNAPFFYPASNVIAYSDNMIGNLPIYAIFRFLNFSREESLQLWWLALFALNYFISFLCFYKYSNNIFASVVVSYLFTFGIINLSQLNYLQINAKFMLPVIFVSYLLWLIKADLKYFYWFAAAVFVQLILGIYYTTFVVLFISVITLVYILLNRTFTPFKQLFNIKKNKTPLILITIIAALSILYMLPYIEVAKEGGVKKYANVENLVPKFQSLISAHPATIWRHVIGFGDRYFPDSFWLHQYCPGIFPFIVLLSILVLIIIRSKFILSWEMKITLFSFLILLLISVRWNDHFSPLQLFYKIKLMGAITFVSRILLVLDVIFLLMALNLISRMLQSEKKYVNFGIFSVLLVAVILDNYFDDSNLVRIEKQKVIARYQKLDEVIPKEDLKRKKIMAIVQENVNKPDRSFMLDAMMYSQSHNISCVNGYSSGAPTNMHFFISNPARKQLKNWCSSRGVDTSVVIIVDAPLF